MGEQVLQARLLQEVLSLKEKKAGNENEQHDLKERRRLKNYALFLHLFPLLQQMS
ncbi:hypothetical protein M2138_002034 [Dysgonomonadaceae bacterium PH5-43]|nr:hypothetical protein [Dysgonomonadaceae bacterium PH5-43]